MRIWQVDLEHSNAYDNMGLKLVINSFDNDIPDAQNEGEDVRQAGVAKAADPYTKLS